MLNFFFPIFDYLNNGPFVRRIVTICLQVCAVIAALAGIAAAIAVLKLAFMAGAPAAVSFAGFILAALFIAAGACVAQICLYRSARIGSIEPGHYIFIGIAAHLIRMSGEIAATIVATVGVGAFLAAVVAGSAMGPLDDVLPGPLGRMSTSGFGGMVVLLFCLAIAFGTLVAGYLLAEGLQLCTDVAVDVHSLSLTGYADGLPVTFPRSDARSARTSCSRCSGGVEPGNAFCTACGSPVAVPAGV